MRLVLVLGGVANEDDGLPRHSYVLPLYDALYPHRTFLDRDPILLVPLRILHRWSDATRQATVMTKRLNKTARIQETVALLDGEQ
jgi:hypothetical protein